MSNNYQLAFAPDLPIDVAEFVAQWNATPRVSSSSRSADGCYSQNELF